MSQIARQAGLGRESLYKAPAPEGNPEFATILKVACALGLQLHAALGKREIHHITGAGTGLAGQARSPVTRSRYMVTCAVMRRQALWCFGAVRDTLLDVKKRLSTNLTIVGAWNTAILTPEWVVQRVDWLKTDERIPIEVSIGTPQNIRFRVHGVLVQPTPNRLDLVAEEETSQTYDLIARMATSIVERLPHTPIRAVGHNLSFYLENGEGFSAVPGNDLDSVQDQYRRIGGGDAVNEIQIKHAVESSRYTLHVTYGLTRENLVLDLNYHYPIVEGVDMTGILKEFPDNIYAGNELAQHLVETS